MKKITSTGILFCLLLFGQTLYSQCNVSSDIADDGTKIYMHSKEKIYANTDFENGILAAYAQLVVFQQGDNKDMLKFVLRIDAGRKGSKQMVVPRQIKIYFTDGLTIELTAESLESPRMVSGVFMQQSTFRLNSEYYTKLQSKSLSKVVISDNREGTQLICTPYKDILKEQSNCIVSKMNL